MKLQYLGTAAAEAWPALFCRCEACKEALRRGGKNLRTRSQAIIDDVLLMDFCPDTLMHMYRWGIDLPNLKHCLITHTHEDHYYPDDLKMRCPMFANNVDEIPFTIYGNDELVRRTEEIRAGRNGELWVQGLAWQELRPYEPAAIAGYTVTPTLAHHNPAENCFNYIIQKDGSTLFYGHDTGPLDEAVWEKLRAFRFDFVSLDCTMLVSPWSGTHMNADDVCRARERMLREGCADAHTVFCINHFSHNGAFDSAGRGPFLHEELEPLMAARGFLVSYDGMTVEF